ncbi:MAG: precorrin-6A/cobalt-precorrin-6A reductase [Spirochaetaceae bacterium]|jgi:siroheme synthase-like protein|nr:precorrin-6A/cobalt-precorrin-6A reductase [Spirochaetaceae bacterium]
MTVFVFAGTGDGRKFIVSLLERAKEKPLAIHVFCATEYGAELIKRETGIIEEIKEIDGENFVVHSGRLGEDEMLQAASNERPDYIVDCTHPFAEIVTKNIKSVCENMRIPYLRLLRETAPARFSPPDSFVNAAAATVAGADVGADTGRAGNINKSENAVTGNGENTAIPVYYVDSVKDAASFLEDKEGKILLTIGSKELRFFSGGAFASRVYPRVLPFDESLRLCREAGIAAKNIIAMQGPFSEALNRALIRQINAAWLVSKETGVEGGFDEKISAALSENCNALVIRPPQKESGFDAETIINTIIASVASENSRQPDKTCPPSPAASNSAETAFGENRQVYKSPVSIIRKKQFFPVFQNVSGKRFLIVGAGAVAGRRLRALLRFDCFIDVIAASVSAEVNGVCDELCDERVNLRIEEYKPGMCDADFVIAATNERGVNKMIGEECRQKNIPVSVADCKEESTFYFPAIIASGALTIGVTSDGLDHKAVSSASRKIQSLFDDFSSEGGIGG